MAVKPTGFSSGQRRAQRGRVGSLLFMPVPPNGLCEAPRPDLSTLDSVSAQREMLPPVLLQPFELH